MSYERTVRTPELVDTSRKIITPDLVKEFRRTIADNTLVVASKGAFDLVHESHISYLEDARKMGDILVVLITSDETVRRKGPDRPIRPQAARARVIASLGCVDAVIPIEPRSAISVLTNLQPHIFTRGKDYTENEIPQHYQRFLKEQNVELRFVGTPSSGVSTTQLIRHIRTMDQTSLPSVK